MLELPLTATRPGKSAWYPSSVQFRFSYALIIKGSRGPAFPLLMRCIGGRPGACKGNLGSTRPQVSRPSRRISRAPGSLGFCCLASGGFLSPVSFTQRASSLSFLRALLAVTGNARPDGGKALTSR